MTQLLDKYRNKNDIIFPYVNTGTLFDFHTGSFKAGIDGSWVLDGGLSPCTGIAGRGQTYKSGIAGSILSNALLTHPDSIAFVYETEGTIRDETRYNDFVDEATPVSERIVFWDGTQMTLDEFFEKIKEIADDKVKNKSDYIRDCPFINHRTGKQAKCLLPTFVLIDSFSNARSDKSDDAYDNNVVSDSSMNTIYMTEAKIKSMISERLPLIAVKAGIYVIVTAHVGNKIDMNPYAPTGKQLQYMKLNDKVKNVGSKFEFLTTTLIQTIKATVLQDSNKGCEYPYKNNNPVEVNQVDAAMVRCKNSSSGVQLPIIVSQAHGILNAVTNFAFLKNYKNYGLNVGGNKNLFSPMIYPDVNFRRTNLRLLSEQDYKLYRALELTAQLCFIQNVWINDRMPSFMQIPVEQFAEKLKNSESGFCDRVLNSTGVWSTSKQERELLTIMDVLALLDKDNKHVTSVPVADKK